MLRRGANEGTPDSLPPPARRDKQQVNEVALIKVAWPDGQETRDLAVLDGYQAGVLLD